MLIDDIKALKEAKQAIILAHYYQDPDVQDIADFVGDSLELSKIAATTDAKVIVFCGVNFMAETAKILSPDKKVLLPVKNAQCPMALMINANKLAEYKTNHPERKIICYVNSYADVKALSDVCVTSSNAEKIVSHYQNEKILYIPDKNLGTYLKDKYHWDIETWPGYCSIHNNLKPDDVLAQKALHPNALVLIHPEAPLAVLKLADYIGSTKGIIDYAKRSPNREFIIGTEKGILHPLKKANPEKSFYLLNEGLSCADMKMTHLDDVYRCLKNETFEITLPDEIVQKASLSLKRMLEMSS